MLIGEISTKTGLSRDTIRFYEKKGLLKVERTMSEFNNYKDYTSKHLQYLHLIKRAKRFGFTLNEISELLKLFDLNSANCSIIEGKVNEKIIDIDNRIKELEEMRKLILIEIKQAQTDCVSKTDDNNCKLIE